MKLTVTSISPASIPVGSHLGVLGPYGTMTRDVTTAQLEDSKTLLATLAAAGKINWTVSQGTDSYANPGDVLVRTEVEDGSEALNSASPFTVAGLTVSAGSGSPEGVLAAPVGSLYLRTNGSTGTTLYVKETGTGNTGWIAK